MLACQGEMSLSALMGFAFCHGAESESSEASLSINVCGLPWRCVCAAASAIAAPRLVRQGSGRYLHVLLKLEKAGFILRTYLGWL
jgi:hypothetical protein